MKKALNYPYNLLAEVNSTVEATPENYPDTVDTDIEVAINDLMDSEQSLVLHLRFRDGLTYKSIADISGKSVGHIKSVLWKAIRRLAHPARSRFYRRGVKSVVDKLEAEIKELKDTIDAKDGEIEELREEARELQLQINENTY